MLGMQMWHAVTASTHKVCVLYIIWLAAHLTPPVIRCVDDEMLSSLKALYGIDFSGTTTFFAFFVGHAQA